MRLASVVCIYMIFKKQSLYLYKQQENSPQRRNISAINLFIALKLSFGKYINGKASQHNGKLNR